MRKTISELFDQSMDFIKMHYEYLMPFSFLFFVINLLMLISNPISNYVGLASIPLAIAIPYFAMKIESGAPKKFSLFFEPYRQFFSLFLAKIIGIVIVLIILSPMLYLMVDVMAHFNYDDKLLKDAIENHSFVPSKNLAFTTLICLLLALSTMPFLFFIEYFIILKNVPTVLSFRESYFIGVKNYWLIFIMMIFQAFAFILGTIFTCGFGILGLVPLFYLINYFLFKKLTADFYSH